MTWSKISGVGSPPLTGRRARSRDATAEDIRFSSFSVSGREGPSSTSSSSSSSSSSASTSSSESSASDRSATSWIAAFLFFFPLPFFPVACDTSSPRSAAAYIDFATADFLFLCPLFLLLPIQRRPWTCPAVGRTPTPPQRTAGDETAIRHRPVDMRMANDDGGDTDDERRRRDDLNIVFIVCYDNKYSVYYFCGCVINLCYLQMFFITCMLCVFVVSIF
mmetsp:Transcript_26683/g.41283  ORF Transcript_26683/g.41283 Transcript_26683/m.41283 type:complete len:220 (-) Transcript_26683:14-673(-)